MKRAAAALLIFAFGVFVLHAQTSEQPPPPAEWSLSIKSGGAPWEKKFEVQLDQSGSLQVVEEDKSRLPNEPITKLARKIPVNDLKQIYAQAWVSVQNAPKSNEELRDGTWMTVKLTSGAKATVISFHIGLIQEEAPYVAKLLSLINKHLPAEHQLY
ncbi:MAG TPA: hypothetical protein VLA93_13550 [Pyrinomonadaceae bacterium]|nr:hypothetical protein [Pyrinomonadaceae bacterium]